jgi:predicted site-specific integrase-resolvase
MKHFGVRRVSNGVGTLSCAIYARVSSRKQTKDGNAEGERSARTALERQKERLIEYAKEKGYCLKKVFCETASGINENRKQLKKLLSMVANHEIDIILIEFKDRLARFGYTYLVEFIRSYGAKVEVITQEEAPKEATQELVEDMLAIVTCFSAKLYGQRSQRFKKKVKELIEKEPPNSEGSKNNQG